MAVAGFSRACRVHVMRKKCDPFQTSVHDDGTIPILSIQETDHDQ